jgi:hypothetical protein
MMPRGAMHLRLFRIGLCFLIAAVGGPAIGDDVPPSCLASFKVNPNKVSVDISWALARGPTAVMSCGAGELLRERLFVEGSDVLKESDLNNSASAAQQSANEAFRKMRMQIQNLPGDNVPGTLFASLLYLTTKYQLASCLLTAENGGGACWAYLARFIGSTSSFATRIYQNLSNSVRKQELMDTLTQLQPTVGAGSSDTANARSRWVRTQTALCEAVKRDCL